MPLMILPSLHLDWPATLIYHPKSFTSGLWMIANSCLSSSSFIRDKLPSLVPFYQGDRVQPMWFMHLSCPFCAGSGHPDKQKRVQHHSLVERYAFDSRITSIISSSPFFPSFACTQSQADGEPTELQNGFISQPKSASVLEISSESGNSLYLWWGISNESVSVMDIYSLSGMNLYLQSDARLPPGQMSV